ncbi:MAG TPA: transcription elongation factor GreA [Firmicutes bacterium]|jgi:transcription elongation factor GreA|nr:transcription elongation factor GreA [Bacillota bacterium]
MSEKETILSVEGLRRLEAELEHLKSVRRRQIAERIRQSREFGDLSENSEYQDAKEEQAFVEGKILTLERTLRNAIVIEEDAGNPKAVGVGRTVTLRDQANGDVLTFTIVGATEADPAKARISNESPVGRAVMGKEAGEIIEVMVPAGLIRYEVVEVGPANQG